ncbi:Dephospho-CoA kinase [Chitinispirillum alkaliphilum]|nr:Dephospho-CoA kinase [Chitinispirillum alkaliphilum]
MYIGIAGYTGSGKSLCSQILCARKCEIIDGDREGKFIMQNDPDIRKDLIESFGSGSVCDDQVQFHFISSLVFRESEKLKTLNSIVHPKLIAHLKKRLLCSEMEMRILDAALIPMWKIENWFDMLLWIDAPFDTRLERLKKKHPDKSETELKQRMIIQQNLFSAPDDPRWTRVENQEGIEKLRSSLAGIVSVLGSK